LSRDSFPGGNFAIAVPPQECPGRAILWATKTRTVPPERRLLETALAAEALGEFCGEAPQLVLPYCDGTRSNQISCIRAWGRQLSAMSVQSAVLFDLHGEEVLAHLSAKVLQLSTINLWAERIGALNPPVDLVVSPDRGRAAAAAALGAALGAAVLVLDKNDATAPLPPSVGGSHGLIFDDEVVSGRTLRSAAARLRRAAVRSLGIAVTYGLCGDGVLAAIAASPLLRFFAVGDLVDRPSPPPCEVLALAGPLLGEILRR
jgi:phosphoribosylpyrophosphate synthetase